MSIINKLKRALDIPVKEDIKPNTIETLPTFKTRSKSEAYSIVEFVAIPSNFDITTHLKMRERMGLFDASQVNVRQLEIISMAVSSSPVFTILNNPNISMSSCWFFLSLMDELNLIVRKIKNPLRRNKSDYERLLKLPPDNGYHIDDNVYYEINFIIVNVMQFVSMEIAEEAWNVAEKIEEFQLSINVSKNMEDFKNGRVSIRN